MRDIDEITEADEAATSKATALENLRAQVASDESMGIVDMYERAAWGAGASVAETDAVLREDRERRQIDLRPTTSPSTRCPTTSARASSPRFLGRLPSGHRAAGDPGKSGRAGEPCDDSDRSRRAEATPVAPKRH
jgi:hypothetical protein